MKKLIEFIGEGGWKRSVEYLSLLTTSVRGGAVIVKCPTVGNQGMLPQAVDEQVTKAVHKMKKDQRRKEKALDVNSNLMRTGHGVFFIHFRHSATKLGTTWFSEPCFLLMLIVSHRVM